MVAVADLSQEQRLLALPTADGHVLFPSFQFHDGRPLAVMPRILRVLDEAGLDAWSTAAWFRSPQELLGGETPADWLNAGEDGALVVQAAECNAVALAR